MTSGANARGEMTLSTLISIIIVFIRALAAKFQDAKHKFNKGLVSGIYKELL